MSFTCKGSLFPFHWTAAPLWLMVAVFVATMGVGKGSIAYDCGGLIKMSGGQTGVIRSPSYPGGYPNYTRCIWIFEAPADSVVNLSVTFVGETYASACSDYVEFRDGGQTGDIILTNCATMSSQTVVSSGRWMYVYFKSDGFSQVDGLSAAYSNSVVGAAAVNGSIASPIKTCRSYEFTCSNSLCLSRSYRCDGYYDCGCGTDCDEDGCGGLSLTAVELQLIGLSVGVTIFVTFTALGRLFEKQHNWENEASGPGGGPGGPGRPRRVGWQTAGKWRREAKMKLKAAKAAAGRAGSIV